MRVNKKIKATTLFAILSINVIIAIYFVIISFAQNSQVKVTDGNVSVSAYIKETGVNLGPQGTQSTDSWRFTDTKTLVINADFTKVTTGIKEITVNLPIGLKMITDPKSLIDGSHITDVDTSEFAKSVLEGDDIRKATKASITPKSGKIKFIINDNMDLYSLNLFVSVDEEVWNRNSNISATGDNDAITVSVSDGITTPTVKLNKVIIIGEYDKSTYFSTDITNMNIAEDETFKYNASIYIRRNITDGGDAATVQTYFKELKITFDIPHYTNSDGEIIYADIDLEKTKNDNEKINKYSEFIIDEESHKINIILNDIIFYPTSYSIYVKFPSSKFKSGMTLSRDSDIVYIKGYNDKELQLSYNQQKKYSIKIVEKDAHVLNLKGISKDVFFDSNNLDLVQHLGIIQLTNTGTGSAYNRVLKYNFDIDNTNNIGVTTLKMIYPYYENNAEYNNVEVKFVLWDKTNSDETYTGKVNVSRASGLPSVGILLSRNKLIEALKNQGTVVDEEKNLYIKQIEYTIPEIPKNFYSYNTNSPYNINSSGNFYGNIFANSGRIKSSLQIGKNEGGEFIKEIENVNTSVLTANGCVPANPLATFTDLNNKTISQIQAGEEFKINITAQVSNYPYYSSTALTAPVVYIRLPKGLELKEGSIIVGNNLEYNCDYSNPRLLSDGSLCYKIEIVDEKAVIGYYNEMLGAYKNSDIKISGVVKVSINTQSQQIELRDTIFLQDKKNQCHAFGSVGAYYKEDKLGINDLGTAYTTGGKTYIATTNADIKLMVNANKNWLDVKASISNDEINYTNTETSFIKDANQDKWTYRLNISNNSEGIAVGEIFRYYIPIPKMNNNNFGLNLIGKVQEQNNSSGNLFSIGYSKDATSENYDNKLNTFETLTGTATYIEDVSNWTEEDFKQVTMLKVIIKPISDTDAGKVDAGSVANLLVPLKYAGTSDYNSDTLLQDNLEKNAGLTVTLKSFGYLKYVVGNTDGTSGDDSSNDVTIGLKSVKEYNAIVTAFSGEPTGDVSKTVNVSLPAYTKLQSLKINSVKTNGVILVDSISTQEKDSWNNTKANSTFAIGMKLNSGTNINLLETSQNSIGTIGKNNSTLTFTLDNAKAISDISSQKSVDITVVSDDCAVEFLIHLQIDRQYAIMDATVAITSGKLYKPFQTEENVKITQNSSVSISYVMKEEYLPENYREFNLEFGKDIPANTKITMIDISAENDPNYYYYIVNNTITNGDKLNLISFIKMSNDGNYVLPTGDTIQSPRKYIFIFDFETANPVIENDYSVTLGLTKQDSSIETLGTLKFGIGEKTNLQIDSLKVSKNTFVQKEEIELSPNLVINKSSATDTYNENKNIVAYVSLEDTNGNEIKFPQNTYITYNGNEYCINESNAMIPIEIGKLDNIGRNIVDYNSKLILYTNYEAIETGEYRIKIKYYLGYNEDYYLNKDLMAEEKTENITIQEKTKYGFRVTCDTPSERAIKVGKSGKMTLKIDYTNIENVSVRLYKMEQNGESLSALNLISNNSSEITLDKEKNTYTWELNTKETAKKDTGKYQLRFEVKADGKTLYVVPYTILIVNE